MASMMTPHTMVHTPTMMSTLSHAVALRVGRSRHAKRKNEHQENDLHQLHNFHFYLPPKLSCKVQGLSKNPGEPPGKYKDANTKVNRFNFTLITGLQ